MIKTINKIIRIIQDEEILITIGNKINRLNYFVLHTNEIEIKTNKNNFINLKDIQGIKIDKDIVVIYTVKENIILNIRYLEK